MSKFHHPISRPVWCGCAVIAASLPQTSNVDPAWWADQHTAAMRAHETDACGRAAGDGSLVRCGGTLNPLQQYQPPEDDDYYCGGARSCPAVPQAPQVPPSPGGARSSAPSEGRTPE